MKWTYLQANKQRIVMILRRNLRRRIVVLSLIMLYVYFIYKDIINIICINKLNVLDNIFILTSHIMLIAGILSFRCPLIEGTWLLGYGFLYSVCCCLGIIIIGLLSLDLRVMLPLSFCLVWSIFCYFAWCDCIKSKNTPKNKE